MTKIVINDLNEGKELDRKAMATVRGGVKEQTVIRNGEVVIIGCTEHRPGDILVY